MVTCSHCDGRGAFRPLPVHSPNYWVPCILCHGLGQEGPRHWGNLDYLRMTIRAATETPADKVRLFGMESYLRGYR